MLSQNVTRKHDQLVVYASKLLNNATRNYNITKWEALTMVFALYKFKLQTLSPKQFLKKKCKSQCIGLFSL
jgi:hypothetical protein